MSYGFFSGVARAQRAFESAAQFLIIPKDSPLLIFSTLYWLTILYWTIISIDYLIAWNRYGVSSYGGFVIANVILGITMSFLLWKILTKDTCGTRSIPPGGIANVFSFGSCLYFSAFLLLRMTSGSCMGDQSSSALNQFCNRHSMVGSQNYPLDFLLAVLFIPVWLIPLFSRSLRSEVVLTSCCLPLITLLLSAALGVQKEDVIIVSLFYVLSTAIVWRIASKSSADINDLVKECEDFLSRAEEQRGAHEQEMRHMVSNVAHDLKTPLMSYVAAMSGMSAIVAELAVAKNPKASDSSGFSDDASNSTHNPLNSTTAEDAVFGRFCRSRMGDVEEYLQDMKSTSSFLLMAINRLIDATKALNGVPLVPNLESVLLSAAVTQQLHIINQLQHRVPVRLQYFDPAIEAHGGADVPSNLSTLSLGKVLVDEQWLQESLLCLLHNAVKYSSVTLTVSRGAAASENTEHEADDVGDEVVGVGVDVRVYLQDRPAVDSADDMANSKVLMCSSRKKSRSSNTFCSMRSSATTDSSVCGVAAGAGGPENTGEASSTSASNSNRTPRRSTTTAAPSSTESKNLLTWRALRRVAPLPQQQQQLHQTSASQPGNDIRDDSRANKPTPLQPSASRFVCIEVQDCGGGLTDEDLSRLFQSVDQAQRISGGTGLGLYSLSQRLHALGGSCGAHRRKDGKSGSVIWFAFPYYPCSFMQRSSRRTLSRDSSINGGGDGDSELGSRQNTLRLAESVSLAPSATKRVSSSHRTAAGVALNNDISAFESTIDDAHAGISSASRQQQVGKGQVGELLADRTLNRPTTLLDPYWGITELSSREVSQSSGCSTGLDPIQVPPDGGGSPPSAIGSVTTRVASATEPLIPVGPAVTTDSEYRSATGADEVEANASSVTHTCGGSSYQNAASELPSSLDLEANITSYVPAVGPPAASPNSELVSSSTPSQFHSEALSPDFSSVEGLRVLVVDDSMSVVKITGMMLRRKGCLVDTAENGLEAVERVREHWKHLKHPHHPCQQHQQGGKSASHSHTSSLCCGPVYSGALVETLNTPCSPSQLPSPSDQQSPSSNSNSKIAIPAFDCILMDTQMPVMDGLEAVRIIRREEHDALAAHASESSPPSLPPSVCDHPPVHGEARAGEFEATGFVAPSASAAAASVGNISGSGMRQIIIIGMSACGDSDVIGSMQAAGADAFMTKPFTFEKFKDVLGTVRSGCLSGGAAQILD